jgi:hypothetical protein
MVAASGISLRFAYLLAGPLPLRRSSLSCGSSLRRLVRPLDSEQLQQTLDLRQQRCTLRRIANAVGAPSSTVARVMKDLRLVRLRKFKPKPPVQRYPLAEARRHDQCRNQTAGSL